MKIIFQCYEIVSTVFTRVFMEDSMEEKKLWRVPHRKETGQISMRMRKRINVWMKRASRWNAYIYIYTHRNFIHGLRTEKAFASITIARREPRGDWNTRIFVELFFFFFFTPRESWKVTRYKIETLPPRAEDQTYFQSHVSFPTSAAVLLSVEELFTNFFPSIFIFFFSPPFLSTIISLLT